MARESGLEKLYDLFWGVISLLAHGNDTTSLVKGRSDLLSVSAEAARSILASIHLRRRSPVELLVNDHLASHRHARRKPANLAPSRPSSTDFAAIERNLEFIMSQLAGVATRKQLGALLLAGHARHGGPCADLSVPVLTRPRAASPVQASDQSRPAPVFTGRAIECARPSAMGRETLKGRLPLSGM
jgi:hypothetical protein